MLIPFAHSFEVAHTVEILDGFATPRVVDRALRAAGLNRRFLGADPGFLPYAVETAVLESVARALGERRLGALVGQAWDYSSYRGYARYILGAKDLAGALERGRRALPLVHPGSEVTVRLSGEHLVLGFDTGMRPIVGRHHVDDGAIFVLGHVLRHYLGPDWRPEWVEVTGDGRESITDLEDIAGASAQPGAHAAVAIRAIDLFAPNPAPPGPAETVTFGDLPALMGVAPPRTTEDAVWHVLRMQSALKDTSADSVASRLSIGPRTLQRLLLAEGTSFREVKARFVEERARALLIDSDLAIDDIALSLGYLEPNSFRRAFRAWTELSPSAYRARFGTA